MVKSPMLAVQSLSFQYSEKSLLHQVSFVVEPGSMLHISGGNGKGKTSLLRLLAGLLQPMEGDILWQGEPIQHNISEYQRELCFLGHKNALHPALTVRENASFFWQCRDLSVLSEAMSCFELDHLADCPAGLLSEGQKRRTALLRLILSPARLWILDEPFVGLDEKALQILHQCFKKHLAGNRMILLTSHQAFSDKSFSCQEFHL